MILILGFDVNALKHIAIIMDGNGRWATQRGHSRVYGHVRGAKVAKDVIEYSAKVGIPYLTLYAFSTENWLRPKEEVSVLMKLLRRQLQKERKNLLKQNIRFHCLGQVERLPEETRKEVLRTVDATSACTGMNLTFALSYGGREEILATVRKIGTQLLDNKLSIKDVDENIFKMSLDLGHFPDPDLVIRTSGESRISNFMLWQLAYSELFFSPQMWPEFTISHYQSCIDYFFHRDRRFGKIDNREPDRLNS